jgi:hypothetical protein
MLLALSLACSSDVPLEDGVYALWSATVAGAPVEEVPGIVLTLDVEGNEALFTLGDEVLARPLFRLREADGWIEDCPGNFSSQRLEAVDIDEDVLTLGDLVVEAPVLSSDCAPEKGRYGGVNVRPGPAGDAAACAAGTCLSFENPLDVAG